MLVLESVFETHGWHSLKLCPGLAGLTYGKLAGRLPYVSRAFSPCLEAFLAMVIFSILQLPRAMQGLLSHRYSLQSHRNFPPSGT